MSPPPHHLRRLSVEVSLPDLDMALALRGRVECMARGPVAAVLERVMDALVPAGRHVFLDRLDLDLGTLPAERLEEEMLAALERTLTRALEDALGNLPVNAAWRGAGAADEPRRSLSAEEVRLELAEIYLAGGTYPFWAGTDAAAPASLLRGLAAGQPGAVAALLRRRGRDRAVLERLVLHLDGGGLRRLLAALEPAEAATILAWMRDIPPLYRAEPLPEPAPPGLDRLLWLLTFDFLVREAGSQFNRRSFLRSLLTGLAEAEGLDYPTVLAVMRRAVDRLGRQRALGSSLPAVLRELLEADGPFAGQDSPAPDRRAGQRGDAAGMPADEAGWLDRLRAAAGDAAALEALLAGMEPALFGRLLHRLEPAHAALVLLFLAQLSDRHREQALLTLSGERFDRLTRLLTLSHLLRDPGSQFNRRSWLRAVLAGLAAREGIGYAALLGSLVRALAPTRGHRPAAFSLPGLVAELAAEDAAGAPPFPAIPGARVGPQGGEEGTAALLRQAERFLAGGGSAADGAALVALARHAPDRLAALVRRLTAPGAARPPRLDDLFDWLTPEELALALAPDQVGRVAAWAVALGRVSGGNSAGADPFPHGAAGVLVDALLRGAAPPVPQGAAPNAPPEWERPGRPAARPGGAGPDATEWEAAGAAGSGSGERAPRVSGAGGEPGVERAAVLAWLRGAEGSPDAWDARLDQGLAALIAAGDSGLDAVLAAGLADERVRARWAALLPEDTLARLLHRLEPGLGGLLLDVTTVLGAGWRQACPEAGRGAAGRKPWALLMTLLAAVPAGHRSPRDLVDGLVRGLAGDDPAVAARLLDRARFLAAEGARVGVAALLREVPPPGAAAPPAAPRPRPWQVRRPAPGAVAEGGPMVVPMMVDNAGLVLLNPFLPLFLDRMGVLTPGPDGVPRVATVAAATRAVRLLQYLVDGRLDRAEPDLVLNKLLCGLDPATPVGPALEATDEDRGLCDGLLGAVLAHWTIIGNSSPAALRETFLQREGRLSRGADGWALQVQRKTVDVLVDRIPWAFSVLFHRWMGEPLHVTW